MCDPSMNEAVGDLDRSMHGSLWVQVAHSSFIEGSHTTKNTAFGVGAFTTPNFLLML
jgi:hypothetical protein